MSGCLFKNERKRNDKDPSWQGQGETDDGRGFWIAAWVNEDSNGNKRINMKFTFKDERPRGRGNGDAYRQQSRGGGHDRSARRNEEEFDDHDRQRGQQTRRAEPPPRSNDDDDMDDDIPF